MASELMIAVRDRSRLAALRRLGLLDTAAEVAFDRLARLASLTLHAPVALVTLVDSHRQFFKSCLGLPEPWATVRETPLKNSFCKHVVATGEPLVVRDSRLDARLRNNPAIEEIGVVAYLGLPLFSPDGFAVGTLCVIDRRPRMWTEEQIEILKALARLVMTEIELRWEIKSRQHAEELLARANSDLEERVAKRTAELNRSHKMLRKLGARLEGAREEEARRISRELHDGLGQALTRLKMDVARLDKVFAAKKPVGESAARAHFAQIASAIDETIDLVRKIAMELRPAVLDDLGLPAAIEWLAKDFQKRTGIRCVVNAPEECPNHSPDRATAVFRIFQEALTNIARHAEATRVEVTFECDCEGLKFEVCDNGRGISAAQIVSSRSLGLVGMKERALRMAGRCEIEPGKNGGTVLRVSIPSAADLDAI
ncbi:MAG: GAF domain-containing sensor histidine kinase [Verrucomicrobiota bacterium]|nr:GAF domain-containing sensor histidine kinase [Verrucomicrobiota bacterium]